MPKQINEIWKEVANYEGVYAISNLGRVKSLISNQLLNPSIYKGGYARAKFSLNNIQNRIFVHRLVAIAFVPNSENKKEVNHKDGNKLNNNADNLEWCTPKENSQHALINGLCDNRIKNCSIELIDTISGIVYPSISECSRVIKVDKGYLSSKVRGIIKNNTSMMLLSEYNKNKIA